VGFLFLCVAVCHALLGGADPPPNSDWIHAQRLLDRYEAGRPEAERDYESETYRRILDHLAAVPSGAPERVAAQELINTIHGKITAQRARSRWRMRELAERQASQQRRDASFFEGIRRGGSFPDRDDAAASPRFMSPPPPASSQPPDPDGPDELELLGQDAGGHDRR
jgi:hypothetical protein